MGVRFNVETDADQLIPQLAGLIDPKITATLETDAVIPSGVHANGVRTVNENRKSLILKTHQFEKEQQLLRNVDKGDFITWQNNDTYLAS